MSTFGPTNRVDNAKAFAAETYHNNDLLDVYDHSLAVRENVIKFGEIIEVVAILHDVVEDTPVTNDEIRTAFGNTVADAVEALTHRDNEPYHAGYLERVKANPIAWIVKAKGDLPHNMSRPRVEGWTEDKVARMRQKYALAAQQLAF